MRADSFSCIEAFELADSIAREDELRARCGWWQGQSSLSKKSEGVRGVN